MSTREFTAHEVRRLEGHTAEVLSCSWSPEHNCLATASNDGSARMWSLESPSAAASSVALPHDTTRGQSVNVTHVAWSVSGRLATATAGGQVRVWSPGGALETSLLDMQSRCMALQWSPVGEALLACASGGCIATWDAARQSASVAKLGGREVLDVDWRDCVVFVAAGSDGVVQTFEMAKPEPLRSFVGHIVRAAAR